MATSSQPGAAEDGLLRRNKWTFSIGTLGRDMTYALVSMYLIYYLTEALDLSDWVLGWVSVLILLARLVDAVLDIVMGSIVDNTRSRFGHYKPWILIGTVAVSVTTILLFTDLGLADGAFIGVFAGCYMLWSVSWTTNDIPYWSLLPALTLDQKQREQIGALAKIFATIGLFAVVVAVIPVTSALGAAVGVRPAWTIFATVIIVIMVLGQCVTLLGTREPKLTVEQEKVTPKQVLDAVVKNDQLLWTAIAMVLFMTGYITTTTFGTYFFKYAYGDEGMYAPFGAVLGVGQVIGYLVFPLLRRRLNRRGCFRLAVALITVGYVAFFFAPMDIFIIAAASLLLFIGTSFVIVLMIAFITDTIDYGHWKSGRRNTAVTFALQPFINKVGAALAAQIAAMTLIASGINAAQTPADVTAEGLFLMKVVMLILPLGMILIAFFLHSAKYKIDEAFHDQILADLAERGQLAD
ncbi:MAG: glycoside-pentoside-hexuronide (GPH):cation symporter [Propionibacteriaceae bacterium]|nr:glycoside-pentoside-hexuronide (GPH):cation symporter [Propionibacteriaceae bacterium]